MLPTAHLIPCEVLEESGSGSTRLVQLRCFEDLLPLKESGPAYIVFWPYGAMPEALEEFDWEAALRGEFDRESLLIPRASVLRSLTEEGQLVAFPLGDPFDLEPQGYRVDWSDGESLTLTLINPLVIADLLGPEPPTMPVYPLAPVAYELHESQAREGFGARGEQVAGEHFRYRVWALETFPDSYQGQLPTLPHLAPVDEAFDAVERLLVFDRQAVAAARAAGWEWSGRVWVNPRTGESEEGALYAGFEPGLEGRVRCLFLHYYEAGQAITALVDFGLTFEESAPEQHRWSSNEPFPELPEGA